MCHYPIRRRAALLSLPLDLCGECIAVLLAKRAALFSAISWEKRCNPWIAVLYKTTTHFRELCRSAAHVVEEKWLTSPLKCRCGAFVALYLMPTIHNTYSVFISVQSILRRKYFSVESFLM